MLTFAPYGILQRSFRHTFTINTARTMWRKTMASRKTENNWRIVRFVGPYLRRLLLSHSKVMNPIFCYRFSNLIRKKNELFVLDDTCHNIEVVLAKLFTDLSGRAYFISCRSTCVHSRSYATEMFSWIISLNWQFNRFFFFGELCEVCIR